MKKSTYALIALVALLFVGNFVFFLLLSHFKSGSYYTPNIYVVRGEAKEHTLQPFNAIALTDQNGHRFYTDGNLDFRDFVHIVISDSVSAPTITLSDGWDGQLQYAVEDSTLTIEFVDENIEISPSDITIITPSLSSLNIEDSFPVDIVSGTVGTLIIDYSDNLSLGTLKANQVIARRTTKYSQSAVDVTEAEIKYLEAHQHQRCGYLQWRRCQRYLRIGLRRQ